MEEHTIMEKHPIIEKLLAFLHGFGLADKLPNILQTLFVAFLTSLLSFFLQKSVRDGGLTRYTVNFGYDLCAFVVALGVCLREQTGTGLQSWRRFVGNALCSWMYQWGCVHALEVLPLAVVAGVNSSLNPIFGILFSTVFLSERPTCWFGVVLVRNIVAVWLMLTPMFVGVHGATDSSLITARQEQKSRLTGSLFAVLIALSVAAGLTLQRSLKAENPVLIVLWSYGVNAVLWAPPGASASIRVPVLWPHTANDGHEPGNLAWLWVALAGIIGVAATSLIARVLQTTDLPTFVIIFGPTMIGMNCMLDFVLGNPMNKLTLVGVILVVGGLVMDAAFGKKLSNMKNSDSMSNSISDSSNDSSSDSSSDSSGDSSGGSTYSIAVCGCTRMHLGA